MTRDFVVSRSPCVLCGAAAPATDDAEAPVHAHFGLAILGRCVCAECIRGLNAAAARFHVAMTPDREVPAKRDKGVIDDA